MSTKKAKGAKPKAQEAARKKAAPRDASKSGAKCVVCGDPVAPLSTEEMCWVCRRLKISAWRDGDQVPLQE